MNNFIKYMDRNKIKYNKVGPAGVAVPVAFYTNNLQRYILASKKLKVFNRKEYFLVLSWEA